MRHGTLIRRLKECSTHALMDAARPTVLEAAREIARLHSVIDAYTRVVKASMREIRSLESRCNSLNIGISDLGPSE